MGKRAVIGFPIQLMTRMLAGGLNIGSAIGGAAGTAVRVGTSAITGAVAAATVLTSVIPSITNTLNKESNQSADELGTSVNPLEALITFFDLNANVVDLDEARRIAVVDVPGREGDFIQNLGSKSTKYRISGMFFETDPKETKSSPFSPIFKATFGNVAVGNSQLLRLLERTGVPAPFMYEYDIAEVIIARVQLKEEGGRPVRVKYIIDLIEYRRLPQLVKMLGLAVLG